MTKTTAHITAGREKSKKLLEDAQRENKLIGIISQKNPNEENPSEKNLYTVGTLAKILKIITLPEGNITAITRGVQRFKVKKRSEEHTSELQSQR